MAKQSGTGKLNICKWKQTAKDKLADLRETIAAGEALEKHYINLLANFEKREAILDDQILEIQQQKQELFEQYVKAPEELTKLSAHLKQLRSKAGDLKDEMNGKKTKLQKIELLKKKLAEMEAEMEADGINVEEAKEKAKQAEAEENNV